MDVPHNFIDSTANENAHKYTRKKTNCLKSKNHTNTQINKMTKAVKKVYSRRQKKHVANIPGGKKTANWKFWR